MQMVCRALGLWADHWQNYGLVGKLWVFRSPLNRWSGDTPELYWRTKGLRRTNFQVINYNNGLLSPEPKNQDSVAWKSSFLGLEVMGSTSSIFQLSSSPYQIGKFGKDASMEFSSPGRMDSKHGPTKSEGILESLEQGFPPLHCTILQLSSLNTLFCHPYIVFIMQDNSVLL